MHFPVNNDENKHLHNVQYPITYVGKHEEYYNNVQIKTGWHDKYFREQRQHN